MSKKKLVTNSVRRPTYRSTENPGGGPLGGGREPLLHRRELETADVSEVRRQEGAQLRVAGQFLTVRQSY